MEKIFTTKGLERLAGRIAKTLEPGAVLALYGELGSGKTTFTRFLVKKLGFISRVQSPTFVIARIYEGSRDRRSIKRIHHIDLYRIKDLSELHDIGLEEMFEDKKGITIIEWPETAEQELPENSIRMYFNYAGEDKRKVKITGLEVG